MCILFAEDEHSIRVAATEFLEDAGYTVIAAGNGREAIGYLDHHPVGCFTCLVTDYHMPHALGSEIIERFRGVYPRAPAILTTALGNATSLEWRAIYRVQLLLKPYSMRELVSLVARSLAA